MKQMILVLENVYARFEQKQNLETSPIMHARMLMIQKIKNCIMPTWEDTLISDSRKTVKHQPFR